MMARVLEERGHDHEGGDHDHQREDDAGEGDDSGGDSGENGGKDEEDRAQDRAEDPARAIADRVAIGGDAGDHVVEALIDPGLVARPGERQDRSADGVGHARDDVIDDAEIIPTLREDAHERHLHPESKAGTEGQGAELHHRVDPEQHDKERGPCRDHVTDRASGGDKAVLRHGIHRGVDLAQDVANDPHLLRTGLHNLRLERIGLRVKIEHLEGPQVN